MVHQVFDVANYTVSLFAIPTGIAMLAMLGLGIVVVVRERGSWVSLLFAVMGLTICVWLFAFSWMYCATNERVALWWAKAAYLGVPFIPSAIYHFTIAILRLPEQHKRLLWISWALSLCFAAAIVGTDALIAGLYRYWWGYYPRYGWLSPSYLTFFFGMMIVSLRLYWIAYRKATPGTTHWKRVRAFTFGFSIVYLGSVDYLAKYGIPLYPFGYVPVLVFLVLAARAITRYHLVDITPAVAAAPILEAMTEPVLVLGLEGTIRLANRAACELFERPEPALRGQPATQLLDHPLLTERFETALKDRAAPSYYEMAYRRPSTRDLRTLSLSLSIMQNHTADPVAIVCFTRDITERKRAEEEVTKANELLVKHQGELMETLVELNQTHHDLLSTQLQLVQVAKMESVGRLAAGVAHEVKNPLAILLMGVEYLSKHLPKNENHVPMVLGDMEHAVKRADRVIKGLLDFSAPKDLDLTSGAINPVVEQAFLLVKHACDRQRITVVKELGEDLPQVRRDGNKLEQVFVNLFMNAIDAMPSGGTLSVKTCERALATVGQQVGRRDTDRFRVGETAVVIEVDDTGTGIPAASLPRVFDPFFTTKPTGKGTGLGLAVTKTIIELHGGTIDIRNRDGGGVRVTIMLKAERGGEDDGEETHLDRG